MRDLLTALALMLVLEGCLWALFPDGMRRAAAQLMALPAASLRMGGVVLTASGVVLVWLVR